MFLVPFAGYIWRIWRVSRSKIEVQMDIRFSNPGDMTSSGENGLNIRTHAQVSGGVSVLYWLAAPVAKCSTETSRNFGNKIKVGNKVQFDNKVTLSEMSDHWRLSLYTVMSYIVMLFDEIPISTIELPKRQIQTFPGISLGNWRSIIKCIPFHFCLEVGDLVRCLFTYFSQRFSESGGI